MYINRIILRDVRSIKHLDITLQNDWTQQPLKSVLFTGPNGSGKTTVLRVIAALWWENFSVLWGNRERGGISLYNLRDVGLAAIELRNFAEKTVWLFQAEHTGYFDELKNQLSSNDVLVGVVRDNGKSQRYPQSSSDMDWLEQINLRRAKLEVGATDTTSLPNIIWLPASSRLMRPPRKSPRREIPEPFYQWLVNYDDEQAVISESLDINEMLRRQKLRDNDQFEAMIEQINKFYTGKKLLYRFSGSSPKETLLVQIEETSATHDIYELSSGERQCLALMAIVMRWLEAGGIVLLDEPDLHLHVGLQRHFIRQLERLVVDEKKGQLIVTSHSPTLWEDYNIRERFDLREVVHDN